MITQLTLHDLVHERINSILKRYQGAWLVWCDPQGHWQSLLAQVTADYGIDFLPVEEKVYRAIGSLHKRRTLQERIDKGESFVLYVQAGKDQLGWLWVQALRAEERIEHPLRDQLYEWGWRSQNIEMSDEEIIWLARTNLRQPPPLWGGGGLQPKPEQLLEILATDGKIITEARKGATDTTSIERVKDPILALTIDTVGLPKLDESVQDIERWSRDALVRLLVTQAYSIAPTSISNHDYLIEESKRDNALALLEQWVDSMRLGKRLARQIIEADGIATLHHYLGDLTVTEQPFLSYAAERTLFANTCTYLALLTPYSLLQTIANWISYFRNHAQAFWGDKSRYRQYEQDNLTNTSNPPQMLPWSELVRLGEAARELLDAHPSEWTRPMDAVQWYSTQGWHVERAGEELLRKARSTTTELLDCLQALRDAYRKRWEEYMIRWSDLWTTANCPVPNLGSQGEWLLEQLKVSQPTAVLMIDALRYDIAMNLMKQINDEEGTERAYVRAARSSLPSITAIGMGMALPLKSDELRAEVINGTWQLYHKDMPFNLSIAAQRREWLRTQYKVSPDALLRLSEITKERIPPPVRNKHLFLFDDAIDKLGHDEELEPLGTDELQRRYHQTITLLHACGWARILIVTDHGFIHWTGSPEQRITPPAPNPGYLSRRALAYPRATQLDGPQGLAPGGNWRVAVASGASCFRTYGHLGYFHGGASLQEWIVPCLSVSWPEKAKQIDITIVPIAQILSLRAKIELDVQRDALFGDTLARQVVVALRNATTMQKLFTSQPQLVTPGQERVPVQLEPLPDVEVPRGTQLLIEVLDTRSNQRIAEATTTLMIAIENW